MTEIRTDQVVAGSFRDPSGFVFLRDGLIHRQINTVYQSHYEQLVDSGLYDRLVQQRLLVPHQERDVEPPDPALAYKVITPDQIPFVSYPYEWCFSQLKDAAVTTLRAQQIALEHEMSLKDCSAYNVQFIGAHPILIDTLSFEPYREGEPWIAYRQFCQHFLGPLALMSHTDVRLNQLSRVFIDGPPLDLVSSLLPWRTRFTFSLMSHIHLHARTQKRYSDKTVDVRKGRRVSRMAFLGLIDNLLGAIKRLHWKGGGTEWGDYYDDTNYTDQAMTSKHALVRDFIAMVAPDKVWDLGANTGVFSRLASEYGAETVAFDIDPTAVERNYLRARDAKEERILPLLSDLANPSPGIGWDNRERDSLQGRGPAALALALALIHHLAISNNVPLAKVAQFFSGICNALIIEFVPKSDSQVQRLLSTREDIFGDYDQATFEREFGEYFKVVKSLPVAGSERTLYLMKRA